MSEQQFSASLEGQGPRPRFVLDRSAEGANEQRQTPAQPPTFERGSTGLNASADNQAGPSLSPDDGRPPDAKARIIPDSELEASSNLDSDWREQVSAKVNSYRSRRPRK